MKTPMAYRFSDFDKAGVLYFSRYATFFDESFLQILTTNGINWSGAQNFLIPIVSAHTDYKIPIKYDDQIVVHTFVGSIKNQSFSTIHVLQNESTGKIHASGYLIRVTVDLTFRSKLIPGKMRRVLEQLNFDVAEDIPHEIEIEQQRLLSKINN